MAKIWIDDKEFDKVEIGVAQDYDESNNMSALYLEIENLGGRLDFKHGKQFSLKAEGKNSETGEKEVREFKNFKFLDVGSKFPRFFSPECFASSTLEMSIKPKVKV